MNTETDKKVLRLLKKGRRGILRVFFSRLGVITLLFVVQIVLLFFLFNWVSKYFPNYVYLFITTVFSALMVLFVINSEMDSTAKLTWIFLIMVFPAFGALLCAYTQMEVGHRRLRRRVLEQIDLSMEYLRQEPQTMEHLEEAGSGMATIASYVANTGCFPVYENCDVRYFSMGQECYEEMLRQLQQAKKYIFMEFFIIEEGLMWGSILKILADKVKEGVEVRVMYDGMCEFSTLPLDYPDRLRNLGIECEMFSPLTLFVSTYYNFRDHRKIMVIDGKTVFTGGINLADEYINHVERFGVWKDVGIMIQGQAAESFTLMFLQMWNVQTKTSDQSGWHRYFPDYSDITQPGSSAGFVIPFGDNPMDDYKVGEHVYMDILNRANRYVYIMTPYLILDGELETALTLAARRGVDVRIILPGIPDKKVAYSLAKGHYKSLIKAGVKLYEYTPGFVHAKLFVSDNIKAVVGTINLDYRSLYHHFECAAYLYLAPCITLIKEDFLKTQVECRQITMEDVSRQKLYYRLVGPLVKIVAPLL